MTMDQNNTSNNNPLPRDDTPEPENRIDVNPPYGPGSSDAIELFRKLLARLIASRVIAERRDPPTGLDENPS
jgi:hypothetical protein